MQGCQASCIMHLGQHTGCTLAVAELVPCFDRSQPHEGLSPVLLDAHIHVAVEGGGGIVADDVLVLVADVGLQHSDMELVSTI